MILQSAKLLVKDSDAALLLKGRLFGKVLKPVVNFKNDGIYVSGEYPMGLLTIPFQSIWIPTVQGQTVRATFKDLQVAGIHANVFKARIFADLAKFGEGDPDFEFKDDVITLKGANPYCTFNLVAILLEDGQITIIAGS